MRDPKTLYTPPSLSHAAASVAPRFENRIYHFVHFSLVNREFSCAFLCGSRVQHTMLCVIHFLRGVSRAVCLVCVCDGVGVHAATSGSTRAFHQTIIHPTSPPFPRTSTSILVHQTLWAGWLFSAAALRLIREIYFTPAGASCKSTSCVCVCVCACAVSAASCDTKSVLSRVERETKSSEQRKKTPAIQPENAQHLHWIIHVDL